METFGLIGLGQMLAFQGDAAAGHTAAQSALKAAAEMGGFHEDNAYVVLANVALAMAMPLLRGRLAMRPGGSHIR